MTHSSLSGWGGRAAVIATAFALLVVGLCLLDGHVAAEHGTVACPTLPANVAVIAHLVPVVVGAVTLSPAVSPSSTPARAPDPPPKSVLIV